MNVLYHPQLSMRSYGDGRWLFWSDAQVTKMRAYVGALPEDWSWTWLVPKNATIDSGGQPFDHTWRKLMPRNAHHIHSNLFGKNALEGRFQFDMIDLDSIFRQLLSMGMPDVLLCEVPEHVRAWRVFLDRYGLRKLPIIAMVEHVDIYDQTRGIVGDDVSYYLRQIDGAITASHVVFPLEGMKDEWMRHASAIGFAMPDVTAHYSIWDALFSTREVVDGRTEHGARRTWESVNGLPVINFISRLSDNDRTRYREFFEACRMLWERGRRFEVWVQNPNDGQPDSWAREQGDFVSKVGNEGREDYIASLRGSDIVPVLYPMSHIYSIGFCEAIAAMNLMVTQLPPDGDALKSCGVQFENQTVEEITIALDAALDIVGGADRVVPENHELLLEQQFAWLHDRTVEENIGKVRETIEEVVRSGQPERVQ